MIPDFIEHGHLPPGMHEATWNEVIDRFGYNDHQREMLRGLKDAMKNLKDAGAHCLYLNGSFVTSKELPNDFDACYPTSGVDPYLLERSLREAHREWMKKSYGGEIYPNIEDVGKSILEIFQSSRTGEPKGILVLSLTKEAP